MTIKRNLIEPRGFAMLKFVCDHPWTAGAHALIHHGGHSGMFDEMLSYRLVKIDQKTGMIFPTEKGRDVCLKLQEVLDDLSMDEWKTVYDDMVRGFVGV